MNRDRLPVSDASCASVLRGAGLGDALHPKGYYVVECHDAEGRLKWRDEIHNLITTVGKNDILDKYLKGSAYTQTIRMGLKGSGTAAAGDTQGSHAGWNEVGLANAPTYTGNRKDVTMNAASGGSSVSPSQVFAITSSGTVAGCFINNGGSATKDDTSGVLFSVGDFSNGSKSVSNGDTLTVTYTLSA